MATAAKWIAFVFGVCVAALGVAGLAVPSLLIAIAKPFSRSEAWLTLAVVRAAVGLVLLTAAPRSRFPRGLRVLGAVILAVAALTLYAGVVGTAQASAAIARWEAMGMTVVRLSALPVVALGGFVAYACGPGRDGK